MASPGMLRRVTPVRTDASEELSASFIRVTNIGELGTTLAVTSNRRTLRRNTKWYPCLYKPHHYYLAMLFTPETGQPTYGLRHRIPCPLPSRIPCATMEVLQPASTREHQQHTVTNSNTI
jgi:hypothetical protein